MDQNVKNRSALLAKIVLFSLLVLSTFFTDSKAANFCSRPSQNENSRPILRPPHFSKSTKKHILAGDVNWEARLDGGMHTFQGFMELVENKPNLHLKFAGAGLDTLKASFSEVVARVPRAYRVSPLTATIKKLENGVLVVELSNDLLSDHGRKGSVFLDPSVSSGTFLKTLFPETWIQEEILQKIQKIAEEATEDERFIKKTNKKVVDGVEIVVRYTREGDVLTAFPSHRVTAEIRSSQSLGLRQFAVAERFFILPRIKKMEDEGTILVMEILEKEEVEDLSPAGLQRIPQAVREEIQREFQEAFGITDFPAILEGLQVGFTKSLKMKEVLEQNMGSLTFRERLVRERAGMTSSLLKQKSRQLLIHFGILSPAAHEIESVGQFLLGHGNDLNSELKNKLNDIGKHNLNLYDRRDEKFPTPEAVLAHDAELNWGALFFSDLRIQP